MRQFDTIIAIANELKISRQALNKKAKRLNINLTKKTFSDNEWKLLSSTNRNYKKKVDGKVDDYELKLLSDKDELIIFLKSQIEEKDKQIDHAQQLQLIAEQRLSETNSALLAYQEQEKESQFKKGFWFHFFH